MKVHGFAVLLLCFVLGDAQALSDPLDGIAVSKVSCLEWFGACKLTNLYQSAASNGSLHLLLQSPLDTVPRPIKLGIGFLSPIAWFDALSFSSGVFNATSYHLQLARFVKTDKDIERIFIPIFIHYSPHSLSKALGGQMVAIEEPSLLGMPLWRNIMRVFYSAASSVFSALELQLTNFSNPTHFKYFYAHSEYLLQGADTVRKNRLDDKLPFEKILRSVTDFSIEPMFPSQFPASRVFRTLLLGSSDHFKVPELKITNIQNAQNDPESRIGRRNTAIKLTRELIFNSLMDDKDRSGRLSSIPVITLIKRPENASRAMLNLDALISALRALPCKINVISLETLSIEEQIATAYHSDILIAVHGASMIHSLWMRPNATVIEIFPTGIKKAIYQNLIKIIGGVPDHQAGRQSPGLSPFPLYLSWQEKYTTRNGIFDVINWESVSSKEMYRRRDVVVHIPSILSLLQVALDFQKDKLKFLLFAPWEQLNNQVQGLMSACAIAQKLNRILPLPKIGYKKERSANLALFEVSKFRWNPFGIYFDSDRFNENPICSVIDEYNFSNILETLAFSAYIKKQQSTRPLKIVWSSYRNTIRSLLGTIHACSAFNSINISPNQTLEYYHDVLFLPSLAYVDESPGHNSSKSGFLDSYSTLYNASQFLLLGNMFQFYNFGTEVTYPQLQYKDFFMSHKYASIRSYLIPRPEIKRLTALLIAEASLHRQFIAIHLRRGDYFGKCTKDFNYYTASSKFDHRIRARSPFWNSCWQTPNIIRRRLASVSTSFGDHSGRKIPLYISTNAVFGPNFMNFVNRDRKYSMVSLSLLQSKLVDRAALNATFNVQITYLLKSILFSHMTIPPVRPLSVVTLLGLLDTNIWALVDQQICSLSHVFIGNRFSSFTRSIVDSRGGTQNSSSRTFFF
ncbi:hypothetical protein MDAP_000185 [Mitosporidium daphniae]